MGHRQCDREVGPGRDWQGAPVHTTKLVVSSTLREASRGSLTFH